MASLIERLAQPAERPKKGPPCTVGAFLAELPDADAEALRTAIDMVRAERASGQSLHTAAWLARAISDRRIKQQTINRHIKRECACEP